MLFLFQCYQFYHAQTDYVMRFVILDLPFMLNMNSLDVEDAYLFHLSQKIIILFIIFVCVGFMLIFGRSSVFVRVIISL